MRVLMNFCETRGLSGGANSFLSSLRRYLRRRGVRFVSNPAEGFDIALLNALTEGLSLAQVKNIYTFGKPIIHRKVGYVVSGSEEMRAVRGGVVCGDKLQIDMSPYVCHSVFQSRYSFSAFERQGFIGKNSVIINGVDTNVFNAYGKRSILNNCTFKLRKFWDGSSAFRLAITTWSTDPAKGFEDYLQFDAALDELPEVKIWFIGRKPNWVKFRNIRCFAACSHSRLPSLLRQCHGFIQMARLETCSNAMLEAISCGLPVIYQNSGSAKEIANDYGVEYSGNPVAAIRELQRLYHFLSTRTLTHPYSIESAGESYLSLFNKVRYG
jgi:glycosyltransferase involved in cell wall biosynthesis